MGKIKASNPISISEDERWKVERDLETLMEAKKIEADPKRLAKAQAMAKQKMMEAAKVASDD
jgi:MOSC domain-containing protein YiiM